MQTTEPLAVLERHLVRTHLDYRARPFAAGIGIAEARIEDVGEMHAELPEEGHLRSRPRRTGPAQC